MAYNWPEDIYDMHLKYEVDIWMKQQLKEKNYEKLQKFLLFRLNFIQEELNETKMAHLHNDPEEIVDGLIDICVVAIGTLDAFGVNSHKAWEEVFKANLAKNVGVKEGRPNPLGLPDLVKPEGWVGPSHTDNHGTLDEIFKKG